MRLGRALRQRQPGGQRTLAQLAVAVLRKFGTDAHAYLPGVGVVSGLIAGNYSDSARTTLTEVDAVVGGVTDATSTVHAAQTTTANKPMLRSTGGKHYWQFDGSNDMLTLDSVPFLMSDDFAVVASYTPASLAVNADIFAQRSTASTVPTTLMRLSTTGVIQCVSKDGAGTTATASTTNSAVTAGTVCIASIRKVGSSRKARLNGGNTSAADTTSYGATSFNSAAIGVSPIGTPSGYANGSIGPVIVIKGTVTDVDLLILERWVSSLTPNGPSL